MSSIMQNWLNKMGIIHRKSNPYTAPENGIAERKNGWLQIVKDTVLSDSGLCHAYWGEAIMTVNFLVNRLWTSAIDDILYRVLHNKSPDLSFLRCFGTTAWVQTPNQLRRKGQPKVKKLIFLGYESDCKGYRFLSEDKRHIVIKICKLL